MSHWSSIFLTYQSEGWLKDTINGSRLAPFPQTSASGENPSGTLSMVGKPKLTKQKWKQYCLVIHVQKYNKKQINPTETACHQTYLTSLAFTFLIPPPIAFAGNGACNNDTPAIAAEPTTLLKKERRDDSVDESSTIDIFVDDDNETVPFFESGANAPTDTVQTANWIKESFIVVYIMLYTIQVLYSDDNCWCELPLINTLSKEVFLRCIVNKTTSSTVAS